MKAKVHVSLKPSVLDPQGKAIFQTAGLLGFSEIEEIRQGKYFEISLDSSLSEAGAREVATRIASEILTNPIIEDYEIQISEG